MDFQGINKKLKFARRMNAFLSLIIVCLVASVLFLAFHVVRETNQVVLVPSQISDGMVARGGGVDQRYIEAIALDAAYAMYNVSAANLGYGRKTIERIASSGERSELLLRYDEIGEDIVQRKISTVFRPSSILTDLENLTIMIDGELATYLEDSRTSLENRRVIVNFEYEGASVRVASIAREEVKS